MDRNKRNLYFLAMFMFMISFVACGTSENTNENAHGISNQGENENFNQDQIENEREGNKTNDIEKKETSLHIDIFEDDSVTVLVNKQNRLSDHYAPEDLVTVEVPTILDDPEINQLREVAADALREMFNDAKKEDIYLYARSGYRSYDTQVSLFNNYVENHGQEAANQFSAKPGYSEHQTGLVMDITSESVHFELTKEFGETKEGLWVKDHAHKYGFIIRYPEGKEDITGYVYEPWHLRYLGVDVATAIYESGLTYEEFLVEEGIIHAVNANANK